MRGLPHVLYCVVALALVTPGVPAQAAGAHAKITAPADGAKVDGMDPAKVAYEVNPGPKGDHVHIYVDGKEAGILRALKGSYTLGVLAPGQRTLCVKVVNKAHVPIGVEQCIKVSVF